MLGEIADLPTDHIKPNAENDPTAAIQRPYDCHLSTDALKSIGISVEAQPFRAWWQKYMKAYKH